MTPTRFTALAFATAIPLVGIAEQTLAHGYLTSPTSRNYACKLGDNSGCGPIVREPQSLEAPKGFPQAGPADGQIASAGLTQFSALDAQSASRWVKQPMRPGTNTFSWHFTANHSTANWRYFITRQDWNPDAPLARHAFELQPFCSVSGNHQQPPRQISHDCTVPDRNGSLSIDSPAEGDSFVWPAALARKINAESEVIRAGRLNQAGDFEVPSGRLDIFASSDSSIRRVELTFDTTGDGSNPDGGIGDDDDDDETNGDDFDYVYPAGISAYKAGTTVLGSDGEIYTCKPFPYSGWCTIQAPQYAPATGPNWQDAWSR